MNHICMQETLQPWTKQSSILIVPYACVANANTLEDIHSHITALETLASYLKDSHGQMIFHFLVYFAAILIKEKNYDSMIDVHQPY